jgi:hypothetical protein
MKQTVSRFDKGLIQGEATVTDEGYIRANAVVTRTGIFIYQNLDGSIRKELRHPEDVLQLDSLSSMELIPITNGHPNELVTAQNSKSLSIGYTGQNIKHDGKHLVAPIVITDKSGVEAVIKGGRKELSLGYMVEIDEEPGVYEGERYDTRQRNIRYNHLSIVDKARAGSIARIAIDGEVDGLAVEFSDINSKEENMMSKRKVTIDKEEVLLDESVASHIDELKSKLQEMSAAKLLVDSTVNQMQGKLEKAEAERDSLKAKAEESKKDTANETPKETVKVDTEDFNKAVRERLQLYKVAEQHFDKELMEKFDSLSDLQIKKEVIKKCRKTISLDGKSDIYVQAMYDTILDDKNSTVNTSKVAFGQPANDGIIDIEASRRKMMERHQNAHKVGGK